ncbi:hypothetical protein HA075_23060 [bacterium BFN5]|nr:hypothetical protein HA075_23060 [bacterium BFN5]
MKSSQCYEKGKTIVIHVFAGMFMAIVFGLIFGYFVMLLWNNLLPEIFGLKAITFWQGAGLVVLCRLLFGSRNYDTKHGHYQHKEPVDKEDDQYAIWWQTEGKTAFENYIKQVPHRK